MGKFIVFAFLTTLTIGGIGSALTAMASSPMFLRALIAATIPFAICIGLGLFAVAVMVGRYAAMTVIDVRRRSIFVSPDDQGLLPVAEQHLLSPIVAMRALDVHHAKAQQVPSSLHYSIKGGKGDDVIDVPAQPMAAIQPETFWQLWQAKKLPAKGFLLGYNLDENGEPVNAGWGDLYSSLVGGKSGTGKSTLIRSILAQSALQGGKFVIVDPHFNSGDESLGASLAPLRSLMLCDVAADEKQIVDALDFVLAIGRRRLSGQDKERTPIILVTDETTGLLQRSNVAKPLATVLGEIAQETRKVGVYAMCIGQNFNGRIMDTTIRDSFVSMISMRTARKTAAVQSGSNEFGRMAETLAIGQAVWMAPSGDMQRLAVPNCTQHDLDLVAHHFGGQTDAGAQNHAITPISSPSKPPSKPPSKFDDFTFSFDDSEDAIEGDNEGVIDWGDSRIQAALAMMRLGYSQSDIIKEAWKIKAVSGGKYQKAVEEYRLIIAELAKGVQN